MERGLVAGGRSPQGVAQGTLPRTTYIWLEIFSVEPQFFSLVIFLKLHML